MSTLAIIPARGGSKRIPRKNIRAFLGQPIISYPIAAALDSKLFDEVMVSTDDQEIASVAKSLGATIPFLPSRETASDTATTLSVLLEVLSIYEKQGRYFESVCCLYPTAVFITTEIIKQAHEMLQTGETNGVATFANYEHPIQRAFKIEGYNITLRNPEHWDTRTQDLEPSYYDTGQLYFLKTSVLQDEQRVFVSNMKPLILESSQVQDIDTLEDWSLAEMKYTHLRKESK
ncbi:MAG: Pseudaminic acid CMP-transferase [uncultured bacterium]|nr:MAG: Pseudaminic acid CMP-transferase [uncultured bacterium]KKU26259.1 MAG: Pseudaminic acid CMP-transferase [Microgenomates group bacterium GW2011_GWA2_46_16]